VSLVCGVLGTLLVNGMWAAAEPLISASLVVQPTLGEALKNSSASPK
jgi:hypothetical protein